jgi:hypothetical protein
MQNPDATFDGSALTLRGLLPPRRAMSIRFSRGRNKQNLTVAERSRKL